MQISFRLATRDDVPVLVAMLADDALGAQREQFTEPLPQAYYDAFNALDRDPNNELILACLDNQVIGMLQLTYIPSLSYQGGWRALIESVRVDAAYRSQGIGRQLMLWTLERAKARGCHLAQLSTHQSRVDAHRFYERLGFVSSHVGMKLSISSG
ncbi:MAG: GNAT family N-acetyltransferase [Caldilineaceae bacterium]|nr:GNAT family N-acetyltransferase [Caldilineaceae bacterium]